MIQSDNYHLGSQIKHEDITTSPPIFEKAKDITILLHNSHSSLVSRINGEIERFLSQNLSDSILSQLYRGTQFRVTTP